MGPDTSARATTTMGIIGYADTDVQALQDADDNIAKEFDARSAYVAERHRPRRGAGAGGVI